MRPAKLGIIGLGAIGGSLALAAKRAGITTVSGPGPQLALATNVTCCGS